MSAHRIDLVLDALERAAPNGRVEDPVLRAKLDFVRFDEDVEPEIWLGPPAKRSALKKLAKLIRKQLGGDLPGNLRALLERHDGIAVVGVVLDNVPDEAPDTASPRRGSNQNRIDPGLFPAFLSVRGIEKAIEFVLASAEASAAPPGILPIFEDEPGVYACIVIDPSEASFGELVIVDRSATVELAECLVAADSLEQWLERWLEAGLDASAMPLVRRAAKSTSEAECETVDIGDIFRLPRDYGPSGHGFQWASRVVPIDDGGELWVHFFTIAYSRKQPAPGALRLFSPEGLTAKRAPRAICQKIDEQTRRAILALIRPDVLAALPRRTLEDPERVESPKQDVPIALGAHEEAAKRHDVGDLCEDTRSIEARASKLSPMAILWIIPLVLIVIAILILTLR